MIKGSLILYSCLLFLTGSYASQASSLSLPEQAEAFLIQQMSSQLTTGTQLGIKLRKTNARLKSTSCGAPIQFSSSQPIRAGSVNLKASCNYPRHWSHYIHADVQLLRQVLVSSRPLTKGHSLTANDLRSALLDQNKIRNGFFETPEQIVGHVLNRSVSGETAINPKMLTLPILINQGDSVTIQAGSNGIIVEMSGTALEPGRLEQQIRVENNRSGKTVKARIIGRGVVKAMR